MNINCAIATQNEDKLVKLKPGLLAPNTSSCRHPQKLANAKPQPPPTTQTIIKIPSHEQVCFLVHLFCAC